MEQSAFYLTAVVHHEAGRKGQGVSFPAATAQWIEARSALSGWRRCLIAFAFGFAGALAFPPTNFLPVLAVSFPALIVLLRGTRGMLGAFATGWSFAFGYFLLGLYWIAASMFVDIKEFWWAVPLAVAGLPAACGMYYGIAAAVARRVGLQGAAGVLSFALIWFLADYARGHVLTGFPWNIEGYAWSDFLPMLQVASLTGVYGLTLLTLLLAVVPLLLLDGGKVSRAVGVAVVVLTFFAVVWGGARLAAAPFAPTSMRLRIVQPNVGQAHKWDVSKRDVNFQQLLDMTSAPTDKKPALVIWPETASTYYLEEDIDHRRAVAASLPEGSIVLTGVIRRYLTNDGVLHYGNSLIAIDRSGRIAVNYDKVHLVPFGEYIPFRSIFPGRTLVNLGVDFTAGPGLRTLHIDGLPAFSPLVCYEAIFPGEVARRDDRPQLLINVTNDGWYGNTAGPYQHFAAAQMRAIEEGLPLVRSANTGISGVVDAYGRVVVALGLGKTGSIDTDLPSALSPTLFVRYGDGVVWILFGVCAVLFGALRLTRR
jgi:apolipoprotein N-acyltransferase